MSERPDHDLRDTLSYWAEPPCEREKLSEEERLADFLETLGNSNARTHDAKAANGSNVVGRRSAPRLRLNLPARFELVERTHQCILLNLSRSGALIAILDAARAGAGGMLYCGDLEVFAIVTRGDFGLNALQFDEEISHQQVLDVRRFHETFEGRARRQLAETARQWVSGENKDDRAF